MRISGYIFLLSVSVMLTLCGCSTTNIPEGEKLYVGLKKITYQTDSLSSTHFLQTKEEVDAALAYPPTGAFLGSSHMMSPIPIRLWIYNSYANSEKGFGKWMRDKFGSRPRMISDVNPEIRALVAKNILDSYGYFNNSVDYTIEPFGKNPKKARLSYSISTGQLYRLDTVMAEGFPEAMTEIVSNALLDAGIQKGAPFSASALQEGKDIVSEELRDSGYYYFTPDFITYLADSVSHPQSIMLKVNPSDETAERAYKKYHIGNISMQIRHNRMEALTDSISRRSLSVFWTGKTQPVRTGILLRDIKMRKGDVFSYSRLVASQQNLSSAGIFSSADWRFIPRRDDSDTLDLTINAVLEKPLDGVFEANVKGKSNGMIGPQIKLGLTKRNLFHGGEMLTASVFGLYEWQTKGNTMGENYNSYEYGGDITLEFPRIEMPWNIIKRSIDSNSVHHRRRGARRRNFYGKSSTDISYTYTVLKRPDYFKINTFTFALAYKWQTAENKAHEFSPLSIDYSVVTSRTAKFDSMCIVNPALARTFDTWFTPQVKYSYTYTSPATYRNPLTWRFAVSESGNITSLAMLLGGKKWNEKDKPLFSRSYGQFIRFENELTKIWQTGERTNLVGHIFGGFLYSYGNSDLDEAPFQELFYCGGANSMRAFPPRGIGPGEEPVVRGTGVNNLFRVGSIKIEGNLEYRFRIISDLHGAAFVDVGNIWNMDKDKNGITSGNILKQLASDVGIGLRYDLQFIIIRADWAMALHLPYQTEKSGYFNVDKFSDNQNFHIAIGYPF